MGFFFGATMEEFTWNPDRGMSRDYKDLPVRRVQFGNGVAQLQRTSLARPLREFSPKFTGSPERIDEIEEFLIRNIGKRFIWVRHNGERIKVTCSDFKRTEHGFPDELSGTFKEERL